MTQFKINWTFSGTQVEPLYGIPARRKQVRADRDWQRRHEHPFLSFTYLVQISIPGRSYITFKGEQIYQLVIVWNYREMLMELLGLRAEAANTSQ